MTDDKALKRFHGESEDPGKDLKRWKAWATAKLATLKDIKPPQKGPWLFTLLDGAAFEAVEHFSLEDIAIEEGDRRVWDALHSRFPEKEPLDQMGEVLGEVFALCATEGETSKQWTARVKETFERCRRKAQTDFPSSARGWITINCAGLTEQEKAIIKAKTQGSLEYDAVAAAFRSCFPMYKANGSKSRRPIGALVVNTEAAETDPSPGEDQDQFQDVEAFLADHGEKVEQDAISESEAAEALAVAWKDRRQEIQKHQQARKFGSRQSTHQTSRSFRVEVEELKRRTRCRKCGKIGHWARECRSSAQSSKGHGKSSTGYASTSAMAENTATADLVEHESNGEDYDDHDITFVGSSEWVFSGTASQQVMSVLAAGLVSSPGCGVIDTGCGRTLIGVQTLQILNNMLKSQGRRPAEEYDVLNRFRFGNGQEEVSHRAARIPVAICGNTGIIDAAIISGQAPLLLGRPTLEKLDVRLDFQSSTMCVLPQRHKMEMVTNQSGQLLLNIMDFANKPKIVSSQLETQEQESQGVGKQNQQEIDRKDNEPKIVHKVDSHESKCSRKKITLKQKECRCLLAQIRNHDNNKQAQIDVAELFSVPRFTKHAESKGGKGLAFDIKNGWDLLNKDTQLKVDRLLDRARPKLLVVCPPCTHEGGWENLNQYYRTPLERAQLQRQNRLRLRFCVQQIHKQLHRGGDFLFEHPWGSRIWRYPEMLSLKRRFGIFRVDMCAFGLKCPDTHKSFLKATGLMPSKADVAEAMADKCRCTADHDHRSIEGSLKNGQSVSDFVAAYTSQFVRCISQSFGLFRPSACDLSVDLSQSELECLAADSVVSPEEAHEEVESPEVHPDSAEDRRIKSALAKLHKNLGHPSSQDLVRILKNSKASSRAIELAGKLQCTVCQNHQQPKAALPANVPNIPEFNHHIGLDVKYLPGWKINQRIPCVSLVDCGTSMHIMAPIFQKENAELLKGVLRDSWIAWAGVPRHLSVDPAKPNISDALAEFVENNGITMHQTAADAHWQLGKVERHGQWFARTFDRVCSEVHPNTPEQFVDCVIQTQTAKNTLISQSGVSPCQLVFGKNPYVPQDLLQDDPHVVASDAAEQADHFGQTHTIRQAARRAVLACQDDKALRAALRARPRVAIDFQSGDWVFYWRSQKWQSGVLERGGKWHGAAMVLGKIGKNVVVAHRRSLLRCAPEQLRHASLEEKQIAEFPESELLGIRNLLEKGQFPKSQFQDIVNQEMPPDPETAVPESISPMEVDRPRNAAEMFQEQQEQRKAVPPMPANPEVGDSSGEVPKDHPEGNSQYGPVRRRHSTKKPDPLLSRPSEMMQEDFQEMMQELVPKLLENMPVASTPATESSRETSSPRGTSHKREASTEAEGHVHTKNRPEEHDSHEDDILFCSEVLLAHSCNDPPSVEVFLSAFLQKRMQKELPPSGNDPEVQQLIDAAKSTEWTTLSEKPAVKIWSGHKARQIKEKQSDRFTGSRFVIVEKNEEGNKRIKARWCLQGHLDPDFEDKINSGVCHSPTLSQMARTLVLQVLASKRWTMCLGDIKGAFLEAGPIQSKFRPLYAKQPQGGIPGVHPDDVIEVIGNVYGSNDAPFNWYQTFDQAAQDIGFQKSQFDSCLYFLRNPSNEICGIMGAHVDDTIVGGQGPEYDQAVAALRQRFPYRKWRVGNGEFCGTFYSQDPSTFEITYQQSEYAKHLRPINLTKDRLRDKETPATEKEVAALRAINGAANWLASQTRPDLCVQTSLSQQCFPKPKVKDLLFANQLVHRARQYHEVSIHVKHIPWNDLGICFHSDAGFANAKGNATQAGYILGFVDSKLEDNKPSRWSPFCWKSYKLPRMVSSTLGAEAQSFSTASALAEWMALMVTEAKCGRFDLRMVTQIPKTPIMGNLSSQKPQCDTPLTGITDCKSLYDHLTSSVCKVEDKRVAIDLAILKQAMHRTQLSVRWCPTELMIADGLTKDSMDPADLLRAALDVGEYQLNKEASILAMKKEQREQRSLRRTS